jgi:hypothetical protein
MKENSLLDQEMFRISARTLSLATEIVTKPAEELWNRTEESRKMAKRQLYAMLGLRAAKIRPIPRRMRLA